MISGKQHLRDYRHWQVSIRVCSALLFSLVIQPVIAVASDSMIPAGSGIASFAPTINITHLLHSAPGSLDIAALSGCVDATAKYDPANKTQAEHYLQTFKLTTEKYRWIKLLSPDQAIEITCATLPLLRYLEASDRQQITKETIGKLDAMDQNLMQAKTSLHQEQEKAAQGNMRHKYSANLPQVKHQLQTSEKLLAAVKQSDIENTDSQVIASSLQHTLQVADKTLSHYPSSSHSALTVKSSSSIETTGHGMIPPISSDYAIVAHLVQDQQHMLGTQSVASVGNGLTPYLKSPLVKTSLLNMPVIGSGLNMLEALTGNDWFSNKPLDSAQRMVAFMSILPGSPIAVTILQNTGINLSDALKVARLCDALGRPRFAYPASRIKQSGMQNASNSEGFWNEQTLRIMRQTSIAAVEMKKKSSRIPSVLRNAYANTSATYMGLRRKLIGFSHW